jgi:hypothetical protein
MTGRRSFTAILAAAATVSGCAAPAASGSAQPIPAVYQTDEPYAPQIDPARFVTTVDNPYFPLVAGTRLVLVGTGDTAGELDTIEVLDDTRTVMGVECVVVRDEVSLDGEPVEVTLDWYAQDVDGNVWYFGEETAEYEGDTPVSTAGSWEAGVDGAQPGVIMPADPTVDVTYRQEFFRGEAEDVARVVELGKDDVMVALGSYDDVLVTEDWTPLEPRVREQKFYAPGIGLIMERQVEGGDAGFELVELVPGSP